VYTGRARSCLLYRYLQSQYSRFRMLESEQRTILKMLPDVQNLMELQQADREILRLKEEIAALPKRVAAIEQRLAGTKAVLENAKTAIKADEASRRKYETAIQDLQGKISKYRDQSLEVKTNDQYRALLHEIQFAEQDIRANEDKILELMVNAEALEKDVKAAEAELKAEMAEIEKEKAEARERTAEDEKQLAEWNAKRDKARAGVDPDLLRHYDRVSKFRGTGLAEVRDHKCMGCQVMLRPQTYNDVRSGGIVMCDSCQRILYFDPASEVVLERPSGPVRRRARPKADAPQAWFYRSDYGEHGEVLFVFMNGSGSSSRRIYDFNTGREIGDPLLREGDYHLAFPEDLTGAIRLNGAWDEQELDAWGAEMPMTVLDTLHADLQAAQSDSAKSHGSAKHEQVGAIHTEHPAAS
jgi:predicted  nucleic acid-binding Zn-ribbon protein